MIHNEKLNKGNNQFNIIIDWKKHEDFFDKYDLSDGQS